MIFHDTSANKQKKLLASYGVADPVADWGRYVLVRPWDEEAFMAWLRKGWRSAVSISAGVMGPPPGFKRVTEVPMTRPMRP